jgi:ferredoxin
VDAHPGENLLMLARRSGVHIASSCGGNGSCHQCRVILDAPDNFRDTQDRPVVPRHQREGKPVWLACRGGVHGPLTVQAAPVGAPGAAPSPSLVGWQVGPGGGNGRVTVADPEAGRRLIVDLAAGVIAAEEPGTDGDVRLGRELSRPDALRLGAGTPEPACVLDLGGIDPAALHGDLGHQDGAIYWVEWSPLSTRTLIESLGDATPVGLNMGGVLATAAALLQAGMSEPDGTLRPSRFVREGADGPEVMLVGPAMEAVTPGGRVWTSPAEITLPQTRVRAVVAALTRARGTAGDSPGRRVVTGPPGVALTDGQLAWLGFAGFEFIPWAAGLGAARWAAGAR